MDIESQNSAVGSVSCDQDKIIKLHPVRYSKIFMLLLLYLFSTWIIPMGHFLLTFSVFSFPSSLCALLYCILNYVSTNFIPVVGDHWNIRSSHSYKLRRFGTTTVFTYYWVAFWSTVFFFVWLFHLNFYY